MLTSLSLSLQSLRIIPAETHSTTYGHINSRTKGAPSAPGLHDTLRAGLGPAPATSTSTSDAATAAPVSGHPLEARLRAWESTQESLRMEALRRTFGTAEPVRRGMELAITRGGEWRPAALGGTPGGVCGVHEEILQGREATISWEDVFTGEEARGVVGMHDEMERKLKM